MANLKNLRNETPTGSAFDLNDYIQRIRDVGFDSSVRNLHAALQYARSKARDTLGRGVGVDGGNGAAVPWIQKLKQVERFAAANLAEPRFGPTSQ